MANACLKYMVFIFNFLFFIAGCGLLGIGIWLKVGEQDYLNVSEQLSSESKYFTVGNLIIAVGVIILVVAFFGCCGAIMENVCMLTMFFILLFIIFIMELAAGIFAYVKKDEVEKRLKDDFQDAIKTKYSANDANNAINKVIDDFQERFECCGFDGFRDWQHSNYHKAENKIPESCCTPAAKKAGSCPTSDASKIDIYYKKGCFKEVVDYFKHNIYIVGAASIAFAVLQILGLVFSMMLLCSTKREGTMA